MESIDLVEDVVNVKTVWRKRNPDIFFSSFCCLLLINKTRDKQKTYIRVSVTLKLRDLHDSHTLGCVGDWNTSR